MSLSQLWFAARVGAWLCSLPIVLRLRTLPSLLDQIRLAAERRETRSAFEPDRIARIVERVSGLRFFDLPVFPRACLRRSLALCYVFARNGRPIEIHIGVRKDGADLHAHSWVTVDGQPLRESNPKTAFRMIYSYPPLSSRSGLGEARRHQPASG